MRKVFLNGRFLAQRVTGVQRYALETVKALDILLGRGSDGFQRLYESGLIIDDFGVSYHACAGLGYAVVGGETPRPKELREAVLAEIERVRRAGIPAGEFEQKKRKFLGGFIRNFNSLEYIAGNYTYFRFHGVDLFQAVDALESIRREDVEARIDALSGAPRAASVILPRS